MSTLIKFVKAVFSIFCGGSEKPEHQQHPHHPQHPQHPQQHHHTPQHDQYPPHAPSHPHRPESDPNRLNQQNPHYTSLRSRANECGDKMSTCFRESKEAYARHDGARAKQLSNEGKELQREQERLNREASTWIYQANNKDSKPGEIDLHGLYVREAIERTDQALEQAKRRGDSEVHLIVGKGLHSQGGAAKLKPAIQDLILKHQLVAELDPRNAGVLIVHLNGQGQRGVDPDEITRRLDRDDEGCTIM